MVKCVYCKEKASFWSLFVCDEIVCKECKEEYIMARKKIFDKLPTFKGWWNLVENHEEIRKDRKKFFENKFKSNYNIK